MPFHLIKPYILSLSLLFPERDAYQIAAGFMCIPAAYPCKKIIILRRAIMAERFKICDHVTWNSEAGYVSGRIIRIHTENFSYKGYTHHASENDPQYEIKSDKTDHIAVHKGSALKKTNE
jgi:hypothetical protein